MKRHLAIILATVMSLALAATLHGESQTWTVCYFREMPTDMDASINYPKKDANGRNCAIIKIETPYTGFTFDTGTIAVVSTVQKVGEIWVYVPQGARKITIGHTMGILREWAIPTTIRSGAVYVMKLEEDHVHRAEIAAQTAAAQAPAAAPAAAQSLTTPTPLPQHTPKAETYTLYITATILGATIYVDGQSVGRYTGTPLKTRVESGTHIVGATYKEHSGYTQKVSVYDSGCIHIRFDQTATKALNAQIANNSVMEFWFYTTGSALVLPGIIVLAVGDPGLGAVFTVVGTALMTPAIVASVKKKREKQSIYNLANQNVLYGIEAGPVIYSTPDFASGTAQKGLGLGVKLTF